MVKHQPANVGDTKDSGWIPGLGRWTGEGNGNPQQHSHLGNPMDRGARQAAVRGLTKSLTRQHTHTHTQRYTAGSPHSIDAYKILEMDEYLGRMCS